MLMTLARTFMTATRMDAVDYGATGHSPAGASRVSLAARLAATLRRLAR